MAEAGRETGRQVGTVAPRAIELRDGCLICAMEGM